MLIILPTSQCLDEPDFITDADEVGTNDLCHDACAITPCFDTPGRKSICNGLLGTVGNGQIRSGNDELPVLTARINTNKSDQPGIPKWWANKHG